MGARETADVEAGDDGRVGVDVLVREPDTVGVLECVFDDYCEFYLSLFDFGTCWTAGGFFNHQFYGFTFPSL